MKIVLLLLFGLVQYTCLAQTDYQRIKVSEDIELIKLSENAYVHISWYEFPSYGRVPSNGLIFCNKGDAFMFDTPVTDSLTRDLVQFLTDSLKLRIVGFVPNHWHEDCMGGLAYLHSQQIDSYANQLTIDMAQKKSLPVPKQGFKDSLQLQLGEKVIQCYYLGPSHTLDNIAVWIPSEQILFPGCMVKSLDSKHLGNTSDGVLTAYQHTLDRLKDTFPTARIVIPGHGQFGGLELIDHTRKLCNNK